MPHRMTTGWIRSRFLVLASALFLAGCGSQSAETVIPQHVFSQRLQQQGVPWPNLVQEESPALVVVTQPQPTRRPWQELIGTVKPYQEWDLPETAIDSLGRIGAPAVERLASILRHPDPAYRAQAAQILARIGPEAAPAVPELIRALKDSHPQVRKEAARALGQIGPAAQAAVDELIRVVEDGGADPEPAFVP